MHSSNLVSHEADKITSVRARARAHTHTHTHTHTEREKERERERDLEVLVYRFGTDKNGTSMVFC